jgi:hypothetical protein
MYASDSAHYILYIESRQSRMHNNGIRKVNNPMHEKVIQSIQANSKKSARGRRYSDFEYKVGIAALNVSQRCHHLLQNFIPIPSVHTIKHVTSSIMEKVNILQL